MIRWLKARIRCALFGHTRMYFAQPFEGRWKSGYACWNCGKDLS